MLRVLSYATLLASAALAGMVLSQTPALADTSGYAITDLGAVEIPNSYGAGQANAINKAGQVAGAFAVSSFHPSWNPAIDWSVINPFVWDAHSGRIPLNPAQPGDTSCEAWAINNNGQSVGAGLAPLTFLYDDPMSGISSFTGLEQSALEWTNGAGPFSLGFLGSDEIFPDSQTFDLQTLQTEASGINDTGWIVGQAFSGSDTNEAIHAAVWLPAADLANNLQAGINDLGFGWAAGINSRGDIVGVNGFTDLSHAFLWLPPTDTTLIGRTPVGTQALTAGMNDLGAPPGFPHTLAGGINDSGQVVGSTDRGDGVGPAFLWLPSPAFGLPGGMNILGTLPPPANTPARPPDDVSAAGAINNQGKVVGFSGYSPDGSSRAMVWDSIQGMQDLNSLIPADSGWSLLSANGINDNGQIAGTGRLNGLQHAFLLSPIGELTPPGNTISVTPDPSVQLTFDSVGSPGSTNVIVINGPPPGTDPPALQTYQAANYFDVQTSAGFSGNVDLCVRYHPEDFNTDPAYPNNVRLLHFKDGVWKDITTSVNIQNSIVCGMTDSFSPFAVARLYSNGAPPDTTPPTTISALAPSPNTAGWNNSSVTVTITAADNAGGSGVKQITYSADGAQSIPHASVNGASASLTISSEGVTTVHFYATDFAGNIGLEKTAALKVDRSAPSIAILTAPTSIWPPNGKMVPITITGKITDNLSGLAQGSASFAVQDSYGLVQPIGAINVNPTDGTYRLTIPLEARRSGQDLAGRSYTITFTAVDNAGNKGTASAIIRVPHNHS